jgi:hypothetical protein
MHFSNLSRPSEASMTISHRMNFRSLLLAATIFAGPLAAVTAVPAVAQVACGISAQTAPPLLPVYAQPPIPEVGYMWTPGYWAYGQVGYYWVPGTWVQPPVVGVLWTPPYWGWSNGAYAFNQGYWGPHVGFYGGVNYGYGYGGSGYDGGRWDGGNFAYNRSANNFGSVNVQNAYEKPLIVNNHTNVSYVGGENGLKAEPTAEERVADNDKHTPLTAEQTRHITAAASDPAFAASHNNGHPALAATSRPAEFGTAAAARPLPAGTAEHAAEPAANEHPAEHATVEHQAEHAAEPAAGAHPGEHAAIEHPVEHAAEPAAMARPAEHAAEPTAARPAVAHAVERPAERAPAHPAVAHPEERAAVHPAVEHAAAPRAAPAHEERQEERR